MKKFIFVMSMTWAFSAHAIDIKDDQAESLKRFNDCMNTVKALTPPDLSFDESKAFWKKHKEWIKNCLRDGLENSPEITQ